MQRFLRLGGRLGTRIGRNFKNPRAFLAFGAAATGASVAWDMAAQSRAAPTPIAAPTVGSGMIPELLETVTLRDASGAVVQPSALSGQTVALLFSADWCPDCQDFLPKLRTFYAKANRNKQSFQIIYISSDGSLGSQKAAMKKSHGDWLYLPADDPMTYKLKERYFAFAGKEQPHMAVKRKHGIPTLCVVDRYGNLVTSGAVDDVVHNRLGEIDRWPCW